MRKKFQAKLSDASRLLFLARHAIKQMLCKTRTLILEILYRKRFVDFCSFDSIVSHRWHRKKDNKRQKKQQKQCVILSKQQRCSPYATFIHHIIFFIIKNILKNIFNSLDTVTNGHTWTFLIKDKLFKIKHEKKISDKHAIFFFYYFVTESVLLLSQLPQQRNS